MPIYWSFLGWKCLVSSFYSNNSSNKCFVWIQTSEYSELMSLTLLFWTTKPFGRSGYGLISDNTASKWLNVMQCYRVLDIVSLFKSVADGQIVDPAWSHSQLTCIYSNTWSNMDLKIHILMRTWTKGDTRSFKVFENQVLDRPVQASRREVSRS